MSLSFDCFKGSSYLKRNRDLFLHLTEYLKSLYFESVSDLCMFVIF